MHRKNTFFVLSLVLLFVVFCSISLSKTIQLSQNYIQIKGRLIAVKKFDEETQKLSKQNELLDRGLTAIKWDSLAFERSLIKKLNFYSDTLNTEIINLNKIHVYQTEQYELETYQVTLKGRFYNMLRVINHLENELSLCEIIHLKMEKKKASGRRKPFLEAQLLLTHIE